MTDWGPRRERAREVKYAMQSVRVQGISDFHRILALTARTYLAIICQRRIDALPGSGPRRQAAILLLGIHYLHCSIDRFVMVRTLPAKNQEIGEQTPLPSLPSSLGIVLKSEPQDW